MSIELPLLRLGLAGFSTAEREELSASLYMASSGGWEISEFAGADAWWLNGARIQFLPDNIVRVGPGEAGSRSLHLALQNVDRPVAFAQPLAARNLEPLCTFEADSILSMAAVLERFEAWLSPLAAQFCLASSILEQETVLGPGIHHVIANGTLIAVVDLRGDTGVLPTAGPLDFEDAMWQRMPSLSGAIPGHFVRCSLSHLMWQYALRTARDILPKRYRTGLIHFRRPPRLSHRLLTDSHLLLLRELAVECGNFAGLRRRTGIEAATLARDLAALYFVGAITTDPRRAAEPSSRQRAESDSGHSQQHGMPSGMGAETAAAQPRVLPRARDVTVPAPMGPV
jgi:hypothetical protein